MRRKKMFVKGLHNCYDMINLNPPMTLAISEQSAS